jgi:hypothetical protein
MRYLSAQKLNKHYIVAINMCIYICIKYEDLSFKLFVSANPQVFNYYFY